MTHGDILMSMLLVTLIALGWSFWCMALLGLGNRRMIRELYPPFSAMLIATLIMALMNFARWGFEWSSLKIDGWLYFPILTSAFAIGLVMLSLLIPLARYERSQGVDS